MLVEDIFIELVSFSICGTSERNSYKLKNNAELFEDAYSLAVKHDLGHLVGKALSILGSPESDVIKKSRTAILQAIFRYERMNCEFEKICEILESANIPHIPLKGAILRTYYPEEWMRTSSDIDILVREDNLDEAVAILKYKLKYTGSRKSDHDFSLYSPNGIHLELHYDTVEKRYANDCSRTVLMQIWDRSFLQQGKNYCRCLTDEMFYFYYIAHTAKHFETGGSGVRSILDIWVMNHRIEYDRDARENLLKQGGLLKFARALEQLSEAWFSGELPSDKTDQLSKYILKGGVYGNTENRATLGQAKMGGRIKYILLRRVFMPYEYLKAEYPVLNKHVWLFPFCQVVRWIRMIQSGAMSRHIGEILSNIKVRKENREAVFEMLQELEL